jgi:hypothetical protein
VVFGHILHNWPVDVRKLLAKKSYDSLDTSEGDAYIVIIEEFIYDEQNRSLPFAMSLHMQIFNDGSQFTYEECEEWLSEAGFTDFKRVILNGYMDVLIGTKKRLD